MSKRNRRQREEARRQRELAAQPQPAAAVQTPAPPPEITPDDVQLPADTRVYERPPAEPEKPPRKFGKPKVFDLGCGITVTIKGDYETLETEFWPVFEGNELHLYAGDAALERRIAKQQGIVMPSEPIAVPRRTAQPAADLKPPEPPSVSEEERVGRALARRGDDPEQGAFDALGLAGIDVTTMKRSTTLGAQLAAVPDEEIA